MGLKLSFKLYLFAFIWSKLANKFHAFQMYVKVAVIHFNWQTWGKYFGNYLLTYYYLLLIKIDMDTATNFLRQKSTNFITSNGIFRHMATVLVLDYTDIFLCAREVNFSLGEGDRKFLLYKSKNSSVKLICLHN